MYCDNLQYQRQDGAALVHLKEYVSHTKFDLTDHKKIKFFLCSRILILSNLSFLYQITLCSRTALTNTNIRYCPDKMLRVPQPLNRNWQNQYTAPGVWEL